MHTSAMCSTLYYYYPVTAMDTLWLAEQMPLAVLHRDMLIDPSPI
jgi:hypothetical protein